ncbi:MAG: Wzz/FepE/Etk N-terminal domain-containing protein, partial [Pseudomonadota bacterium]|nr:Wzz/FepE/Etk N-terminal domain-containing protein [Pseudomonadota bacterium]
MTEHDEQKQGMKPEPDTRQPYLAEDEIDLLELIRPLWRQKILIAAITFLTIAAAVVLVLQATPSYRIYTQLKPGVCRWDDKGNPIPYLKTTDLKSLLTGGVFNTYASEAGLGDKAPKIEAASSRRGDQLTAYFFWPDRDEGKKVMAGFIDFLNDPDRGANRKELSIPQAQRRSLGKSTKEYSEDIKMVDVQEKKVEMNIDQKKKAFKLFDRQRNSLKREIERVNADFKMVEKEVVFLEEGITVAEETRAGYEKSRREIDENTTRIISLRDKLLQTPPDDSLQPLLLASTIQQNIAYLNILDQKIEAARKEAISLRTDKLD